MQLLRRLPRRLTAPFDGAPVLFLGVVLGIALVFRMGIGLVRPSTTEAEPAAAAAPPAPPRIAVPATPTADPDPHPRGHIVDPPPVGSGRLRTDVASPRRKRTRSSERRE